MVRMRGRQIGGSCGPVIHTSFRKYKQRGDGTDGTPSTSAEHRSLMDEVGV